MYKKKLGLWLLLVTVLCGFLVSCITINSNQRFPGQPDIKLEHHDYEILGSISLEFEVFWFLGHDWEKTDYYNQLLQKAKKTYPDTHAMVDITVEKQKDIILGFFGGTSYTVNGIAIKYERVQRNTLQ